MKKDWLLAGCACLFGAILAFPVGIMFAGDPNDQTVPTPAQRPAAAPHAAARDFYSPDISSDPYVLEQQLRTVEALELSCRHFNERCPEAKQARQRLNQQRPG